jgi:EmrB/QacA subfamily drug resistance transporter
MGTVALNSPAGKWVMTSTIMASAMAFIDGTALNVVLPSLQNSLHATAADLFWILNAYLLMLASLILAGGSLGDRLGRKRVFMTGILVFICGSAACGLAPSTGYLIGFRIFQGVGGALMIPGSLSLISSSIDDKERGKAIGTWSAFTTMVTIGGPIIGGALADAGLWRYIFFINVPIGVAALVILWFKVAESKDAATGDTLDIPGILAIALGLAALTFGFLRMPTLGIMHWAVWGSLSLGLLLLAAFISIERKSSHPMMPPQLFTNRVFTGVNLLTFFLYSGLNAAMLFLSLNLVQAQGYSQLDSGLTFLPFTILMISIARFAGALADKYGPRPFLVFGPAAAGLGMLLLSFVGETHGPRDYWTSFLPGVLVLGLGLSFTVAPLTTTVMSAVGDQYSGVASGINNALSRVANVFANAIFGAVAVLLFTGMLEKRLNGMELPPAVERAAISQAADLGNAKPPPDVAAVDKPAVAALYRAGFIHSYQRIMQFAAVLAFTGSLMGVIFVKKRRT